MVEADRIRAVLTAQSIYVKFGSHRAREYALRSLKRRPQAYWSLRRNTGPGGVYAVTSVEIARFRREAHAKFTILRAPYDDLMPCWGAD